MEKVVKKRTFRCLVGAYDFRHKIARHIDGKEDKYKIVFDAFNAPVLDGEKLCNTIDCGNTRWYITLGDYMYFWNLWNHSFDVQLIRIKD